MLNTALSSFGAQVVLATSSDENHPPENMVDGNMETFWLSTGMFPQEVIIRFPDNMKISVISVHSFNVKRLRIEKSTQEETEKFELIAEREIYWNVIKRKMGGSQTIKLFASLQKEWYKVTQQHCEKLVKSMPKRMKATSNKRMEVYKSMKYHLTARTRHICAFSSSLDTNILSQFTKWGYRHKND